MAQFSPSNQTVQVTTGNVRTTVDFPNTSLGTPLPYPAGVFPNPLGSTFWDNAISAANLNGVGTKYRYVKFQSTANPALTAAPAAVWYTDATMTTVTSVLAEAITASPQAFAGLMMPNTTDLPAMTAALINANGGAGVWIAVGGIVSGVVTNSGVAGQQQVASAANWGVAGGFATTALGVAPINRAAVIALTISPGAVYVLAESL